MAALNCRCNISGCYSEQGNNFYSGNIGSAIDSDSVKPKSAIWDSDKCAKIHTKIAKSVKVCIFVIVG
jgi:hypothetical protein